MAEPTHLSGCDLAHGRRQRCSTWAPPNLEPDTIAYPRPDLDISVFGITASRLLTYVLMILNGFWATLGLLITLWLGSLLKTSSDLGKAETALVFLFVSTPAIVSVFTLSLAYTYRNSRIAPLIAFAAFIANTSFWIWFGAQWDG